MKLLIAYHKAKAVAIANGGGQQAGHVVLIAASATISQNNLKEPTVHPIFPKEGMAGAWRSPVEAVDRIQAIQLAQPY